jgi:hypothetical protein
MIDAVFFQEKFLQFLRVKVMAIEVIAPLITACSSTRLNSH